MNKKSMFATTLAAAALLLSGATFAAPINVSISPVGTAGDMTAPRAAEAAFLASINYGLTETFEGFAVNTQGLSLSSAVGDFTMTTAGSGGLCAPTCADGVKILDAANSPFSGRFNTTVGGSKWLDSFDARVFDLTPIPGINAIGFYITDPNDSGGRFSFSVAGGAINVSFADIFGAALANGRVYYLSFTSADDITGLTIFANSSNDGFGIDNVTVGRVPEPGTLALLGLGLLGAGFARRRRIG
jgi:hypothetical protein